MFYALISLFSFASPDCNLIKNISITGNTRTSEAVFFRELNFKSGEIVCTNQIEAGIQRIKRTGLFTKVNYSVSEKSILNVAVDEKWTTIPIAKFNSGGGVAQYILGVYDPNLFGQYIEAGVQYENLAGTSSGVMWYKNPRLFDKNQGIDLQYWNTKRIRTKYDQSTADPVIKQGFLLNREKIFIEYFKEISDQFKLRGAFEYNKDDFSAEKLPQAVVEAQGLSPVLPIETKFLFTKLTLDYGDYESQLFSASVSHAQSQQSNAESFVQGDIGYLSFYSLANSLNFAQRLLLGTTTTKVLQYWHYLGGLDKIRGFSDNRFAGRHYLLSNSELRWLFYQKVNYHLQAVCFTDIAAIGEEAESLLTVKAASLGVGIRIILPKIYRFVIRLDFAQPIVKKDTLNWSLGVQQFF